MKTTREIIESNIAWVITVLFSIGFFVATFKYQGDAIDRMEKQGETNLSMIDRIEKTSLADLNRELAEAKVKIARMEESDLRAQKSNTQVTTIAANVTSLQESVSEIKLDLREVKSDIKCLMSKTKTSDIIDNKNEGLVSVN